MEKRNLVKKLLLISVSTLMAVTSTGTIASAHHVSHVRNSHRIQRTRISHRHHHLKHHHLLILKNKKKKNKITKKMPKIKNIKQESQKTEAQVAPQNNNVYHKHQYKHMLKIAKSKLGDHYRWGATGPKTFDCAGYTQYIYKHGLHKQIPRTAQAQYESYPHVKHAKAGDLVFFGKSNKAIAHVGMCIGKGNMIDAQLRGVVTEKIHAPWWHLVGASRPVNFKMNTQNSQNNNLQNKNNTQNKNNVLLLK